MKGAKKLLSLFLCAVMLAGLLPTAAFATGGDPAPTGGVKTVMAGTSGIKDPTAEGSAEETYYTPNSYIYFGMNNGTPIKWRVLDADKANTGAAGMFLLSEHLLANGVFGENNAWQGSTAQTWARDFAGQSGSAVEDAFSSGEQAALLATAKEDAVFDWYTYTWGASALKGDKVFFLSAQEVAQYVGNYDWAPGLGVTPVGDENIGDWWLRSPISGDLINAGYVSDYADVRYCEATYACGVRPAFNLDLSKVLFTSAAGSAKPDGFKQVQPYSGNEWKLTLADTNATIGGDVTLQDSSRNKVEELTVGYGTNDFKFDISSTFSMIAGYTNITAMLSNNNSGEVVYYGSIGGTPPGDGSLYNKTIALPTGLEAGSYTISVYGEKWNDANKTDYATAIPLTYEFAVLPASTPYDLWVDGTQVTSANAGNVLNKTNGDGEPTVSFDATSNTLTLNNAEITKAGDTYACGIYSELSDLTLKLVGNSTIPVNDTNTAGLYAKNGNLTVTGDGSLTATAPVYGVVVNGNLTVESGTLIGTTTTNYELASGIWVQNGNLTVNGGTLTGTATAPATELAGFGIYVENGALTIEGGSVAGTGNVYGIVAIKGLTVNGGSVTGKATLKSPTGSGFMGAFGAGIAAGGLFKVTDPTAKITAQGTASAISLSPYNETALQLPTGYLPEAYKIASCKFEGADWAWIAPSDTSDSPESLYQGAVKELSLPVTPHMHGETPFIPLTQTKGDLNGGNYYLDKDIDLTGELNITGETTLCLNGKTLSSEFTIIVKKAGSLTICDCSEKKDGTITADVSVNEGKLTLQSGKIASSLMTVYAGNFTMTGGEVVGQIKIEGTTALGESATLDLSGGTVINEGGGYCVFNRAGNAPTNITITGGRFYSTGNDGDAFFSNCSATGGYFSHEPATGDVKENYKAFDAGIKYEERTYTHMIAHKDAHCHDGVVFNIALDGNGYDLMSGENYYYLLDDYDANELSIDFNDYDDDGKAANINICLNGKTLKADSLSLYGVKNVTIGDCSVGQTGRVSADTLVNNNSHEQPVNLAINGGYYDCGTLMDGGNITVSGGVFTMSSLPSNAVVAEGKTLFDDAGGALQVFHDGVRYVCIVGDAHTCHDGKSLAPLPGGVSGELFGAFYLPADREFDGSITSPGSNTICLNGHKLKSSGSEAGTVNVTEGQLTICDCSEKQGGTIMAAVQVSGGKLTLESGKIVTGEYIPGVQINSGTFDMKGGEVAAVSALGGSFNLSGGTVRDNGNGINSPIIITNSNTNITGGTVITWRDKPVIVAKSGTVSITGGYFVTKDGTPFFDGCTAEGGYYSHKPADSDIKENYKAFDAGIKYEGREYSHMIAHKDAHCHDGIVFAPGTGNSYYLTGTSPLAIPGGTRNICLGGQTVKGFTIMQGATLNLYDCPLDGTRGGSVTNSDGTGISVNSGATLNLYGGKITGNNDMGVHMGGDFTLHGGTFDNNRNGDIYLSGGKVITIGEDFDPDGGTQIKVKIPISVVPTASNPVAITGENTRDYSDYFVSANDSYRVINGANNVLYLVPRTALTITANSASKTYDGAALTDNGFKVTCNGTDYQSRSDNGVQTASFTIGETAYTVTATVRGSATNVSDTSTGNNAIIAWSISDSNGVVQSSTDTGGNLPFAVSTAAGTLTINKAQKALTITVKNQEYDYDGTAKGAPNDTITDDFEKYVELEGLATGDTLTSLTILGQRTDAGTYTDALVASNAAISSTNYNYTVQYVAGSLIINADETAPTGTITVSSEAWERSENWDSLQSEISFDKFSNKDYTVSIAANDSGSGVASFGYLISNAEIGGEELSKRTDWISYTEPFELTAEGKYIIYAKITDHGNNVTYISTRGLVLDTTAPVIDGIGNNRIYCSQAQFTVKDASPVVVYANSSVITPNSQGVYTISTTTGGNYTVRAVDNAGNETKAQIRINKDHAYGNPDYTWEGFESCLAELTCVNCTWSDQEYGTITNAVTTQPTCTAEGVRTYTAAFTKTWAESQTTTEPIAMLGHSISLHEAQAATCTAIGWNDYEACTRCSYSTYSEIPALGHDEETHDAQEATCTAIGWNEYVTCTRCDYTTYEEVAALGHSYGTEWTTDKDNHWHECSVCGDKTDEAKHTPKTVNAKEATTSQKGYTGDTVCETCGYEIAKGKVIPVISDPNTPPTGDNSKLPLWIAMMAAAVAGLGGTVWYGRKKKAR